jgi:hypothetical protein
VFLNTFLNYLINSLAQGVREETEKVGEQACILSNGNIMYFKSGHTP